MVTTDPNERQRSRARRYACALLLALLAGGAARADYLKDYWNLSLALQAGAEDAEALAAHERAIAETVEGVWMREIELENPGD